MYVVFDDNNYVKFLSTTTPMAGAIELPDDETLQYEYLTCYKLSEDGTGLILDAQKVAAQGDSVGATARVYELKRQLAETDYKVLRRLREQTLGIPLHSSEQEYLQLEAERESITRQIREIEDSTTLETDVTKILAEGAPTRKAEADAKKALETAVVDTIPSLEKDVEELKQETKEDEVVVVPPSNPDEVKDTTETVEDSEEAKE